MNWIRNLDSSVLNFLDNLKIENNNYKFKPVINFIQHPNTDLELGFSNYALKTYVLLDKVNKFSKKEITGWANYIESFQTIESDYPKNSFVDKNYLNLFNQQSTETFAKLRLKKVSNYLLNTNFKSNNLKIYNYIRAETKQSLASLIEIKASLKNKFLEFPSNEHEINKFIYGLNWNYPWSSGGQLAAISLFSKTQLDDSTFQKNKKIIESFLSKLVNVKDGMYYDSIKQPKNFELVNGAMKVISAMDWLDMEIHYPEKIIDTCLDIDPISEGCDIVDIVYVLHKCSKQTSYKKNEIVNYFSKILDLIYQHYKPELGGFSYFKNRCQTNYYDVQFASESNTADIHGTVLMLWAVIMIMDTTEIEYFNYKIIKP